MKKFILTIVLTTTINTLLLAQATLSLGERSVSNIDYMEKNDIQDTIQIKQDPTPFTKKLVLMSEDEQLEYDRRYNQKFFAPWTQSSVELTQGAKTWQFKYAKEKTNEVMDGLFQNLGTKIK